MHSYTIDKKMLYLKSLIVLFFLASLGTNTFTQPQANKSASWGLALSNKKLGQFTLGYANIVAISKWVETNALYGDIEKHASFQKIFNNIDLITSLNPLFQAPYYLAATLPWSTKTTKESNALLIKAIEFMPDAWCWPYYLGFNAYWFDHDRIKAGKYLRISANLPESPSIVMRLALRMQTDVGQFDTALMFINRQIANTSDETIHKQLIEYRTAILTEKILYNIELLLDNFPLHEHNSQGIQKLIQSGYHIPEILPDGGHIIFKENGSLVSSKSKKRFRLFIPPKRQGVIHHEPAD